MSNPIFEVDVKGYRQLNARKPKYFIIRELLANCFDEKITKCHIGLSYEGRKATIIVEDDSPEGFVDLRHAFTLYADTRKRSDLNVRGRFNEGNKFAISLSDYSRIVTTTGAVEFDVLAEERRTLRRKRDAGSEVMMIVKMTKSEFSECISYCNNILAPANVEVSLGVNVMNADDGDMTIPAPPALSYKEPFKVFRTKLKTEIKDDTTGEMKFTLNETSVNLHKKSVTGGTAFVFEMGIPICEIDCDYSIDVQQKVPLSQDRDKVDAKYLKNLYAEVLNQTHEEVTEQTASSTWIRSAIETGKVTKEAVDNVVDERYGDKVVIANPFDKVSIDDAKANGYRLVYSSELSGQELDTIKSHGAIQTSSDLFGRKFAPSTHVDPSKAQKKVLALVERICQQFLPFKAHATIITMKSNNTPLATMEVKGTLLTFYDNAIPKEWWEADENGFVKQRMLDLIIHELPHHFGLHCDRPYLDAITKLGAQIALHAAQNKSFLKL